MKLKLKILLAALFVAGVVTAFAVAAPPPGKGDPHNQGTSTTTASTSTSTSTTSTTTDSRKVTLCHKTGNGKFHAIKVAKAAVAAHLRHGDVVGTDCSKQTTTTTDTTTTGTTTTTTTSVATTNPA
jgi:hypothetical protein